jgi:hypothetical protein
MLSKAERQAKTLILRRWGTSGRSPPRDVDVCERVCAETGWPKPHRKLRKALMARYWAEILNSESAPQVPETPKAARPSRDFYQSDAWRAVRYEALKLHGARCQCCGRSSREGVVIHVDHIKPRSKYPQLELVLANLQVLCEDCNLGKMARDQTDWRPAGAAECTEEHLSSLNK